MKFRKTLESCLTAVTGAGCLHLPIMAGDRKPRDLRQFNWVNSVLGNLKTTLAGTFHSLKYRKYADPSLAAFAYRFNPWFDLRDLVYQAPLPSSPRSSASMSVARITAPPPPPSCPASTPSARARLLWCSLTMRSSIEPCVTSR